MVPSWLRSPLTAFIVVAVGAAVVLLRFAPVGSVNSPPTGRAVVNTPVAAPTVDYPIAPRDIFDGSRAPVFAAIAGRPGLSSNSVMVVTLAPGGTAGHVIVWREGDGYKIQVLSVPGSGDQAVPFLMSNSVVMDALHETTIIQRDLGIVYDASPYGSGSPTARFALLRLEGEEWRVIWDAGDAADWRGSHGRVEFPQGDLSELVVRSDSWSQGGDVLSSIIHESNPGPHRFFVDTWLREGDGYVLASAETVPAPYATLVEFIYTLGTGDDAGAREFVTDAGLVERARAHGLAGIPGQHWFSTCESGLECGKAEPIRFDPIPTRGEPQVAVFFEERNGRWLISDIQPETGS